MSEKDGPPFDHLWIREILPHRYPLLLVDRVLEIEKDTRIVAIKNVTQNEEFFLGHFPSAPIMPGVLVIEALAQTAAILTIYSRPEAAGEIIYFAGIEKARFRRPVVPGDQLRLELEVLRMRSIHARFRGVARVDGEVAVEAICTSMLKTQPSDTSVGSPK